MSENVKHTPGPLYVGELDGGWIGIYTVDDESYLGRAESEDVGDDQAIANATLWAAAPDLLAACRDALTALLPCNPQDPKLVYSEANRCPPNHPHECGYCEIRRQLEAAIAKAEGVLTPNP